MTLTNNDILNKLFENIELNATVKASGAVAATVNGADQTLPNQTIKGVRIYLDITAVSGTSPTLDVKLQTKDPVSGKYFDMAGVTFAQKTGTGQGELTVYPGIAETGNTTVSDVLSRVWRLVYTLGGTTPSFTFSVGAEYLP